MPGFEFLASLFTFKGSIIPFCNLNSLSSDVKIISSASYLSKGHIMFFMICG